MNDKPVFWGDMFDIKDAKLTLEHIRKIYLLSGGKPVKPKPLRKRKKR